MTIVHGLLDPFFETGTEGVIWSLRDPILPGYDGLYGLQNGDALTVYQRDGGILWDGVVNLEYSRNYTQYPMNPGHGQQAAFGMWVHGFQADIDPPETWAQWFFDAERATLRRDDLGATVSHPAEWSADRILRGVQTGVGTG